MTLIWYLLFQWQPLLKIGMRSWSRHLSFNRSKFAAEIFKAIDGKASSKEIIEKVHGLFGQELDIKIVENHYKSIIDILIKVTMLYLRKPGTQPYQTIPQMLGRMHEIYGEKVCKKAHQAYLSKMQSLLQAKWHQGEV